MKLERDEWGHWSLQLTERAFITPEWEWAQLRPGYNWRTFHLMHVMFEQDGMCPGWEFEVIVLGVGFRLRANDDWSKSENGRHLLEAEESIARGEYHTLSPEDLDLDKEADA
jgi:hypothetical protein